MDSEKDYIDKLYSGKFETFVVQTSEDEWNALNIRLGKSNFLKFSFTTFNIYYLVIMIILVCLAVYFGITAISQPGKIGNPENRTEVLKYNKTINTLIIDSATTENCNGKKEIFNKIKNVDKVKKVEIPQNTNDNVVNSNSISPEIISSKDSIQVKSDSLSVLKSNTQKIKRVKKTVFIKKDNVIVTDTVIIKKKQK